MFIATLRTRKSLIISASILSLLLHAALIQALLPLKMPDPQANVAAQKALTVKLSAKSIASASTKISTNTSTKTSANTSTKNSNNTSTKSTNNASAASATMSVSNFVVAEDEKIKPSQAEVTQQTNIIQQSKSYPVAKNLKPALSDVAKSNAVNSVSQTQAQTQIQTSEQLPKVAQVQASNELRVATSKQAFKQEAVSKELSAKARYQLGSKANPNPDYPMLAIKKGWQGDVVLGVHVAADGSIEHLTFVKSTNYGVLNYAAYETVRNHWRFQPLSGESVPLTAYIEVPISFRFN